MADGGIEVARAYVTIIPSLEGSRKKLAEELGDILRDPGEKGGKSLGKKLLDGAGSVLKTGGKILGGLAVSAATAAVTGVTAITKQALSSFSDYEQLAGGVEKIFSGMDTSAIMKDASEAYKSLNMSANEYLESINSVGAMFKATMGDEKAYETAKTGMQAIADFATGTGKDVGLLNEKFAAITRSTSSYQSIADQFAGVLPVTSAGFLEQAQAAGFLSDEYTKLTEVPIDEYQQAVSKMLEKGTADLGLAGNTAAEALGTISGSLAASKSAWTNFVTALAGGGDIATEFGHLKEAIFGVEGASNGLVNNVLPVIERTANSIMDVFPEIISSLLPTVISTIQSIIPKIVALTGQLIPVLTNAIDQLFGDGFDTLVNDIAAAIPQLITALLNAIPTILNAITKIITSVLNILVSSLPKILKAITDAIPKIIQALLTNLTTIVKALVDAIPAVLMAIIEAVGAIVEMLPDIITMIVEVLPELITYIIEGLYGNLPMIIEGLVNLVLGIVQALPQIIIALVDAIPTIIESSMTAALSCLPQIIVAIVQLVFSIIQQLPSILKSLWDAVVSIFNMYFIDIPKRILNILPTIITALGNIFTGVWNACTEFVTKVGDWFFNTEVGKFFVNLATFMTMLFNEVKSFLTQLFAPIVEFCANVFDKVKTFFSDVFNKVKDVFTNIFSAVKEKLTNIFSTVKDVFTKIYNAIKTPIENAKNTISNVISAMKNTISNVFNSIYSTVSNIFNRIKSAITGPIDTAKSLVSKAINAMKNIINNAGFSLPRIKLPHFSISGSFSLTPPSIPHVSVDWYGKGYDEAQILKDATVFGMANGNLLAGGEHGNEVVVGEQHLLDMISSVVNPAAPIVVNVYGAEGQDEELLAQKVMEKIQEITNNKEVVYA